MPTSRSASGLNVVVIGAGMAGLAAAWRLQSHGHEVSLLERGERAGGRLGGVWKDGFCLDRTLSTLHSGDRRLLAWIGELGLRDALLPLRPLQLAQLRGSVASPIDPQSMLGAASIPGVRKRDAAKLLRWRRLMARYAPLLDATAPERAASLDFRSVSDFVRLYFGDTLYQRWVEPEVCARHSGEGSDLSRVTALLDWRTVATGRGRSAMHGIARRGLHEVPEAAAEQLSIRYGVEVTRVDEAPAGGFTVECRSLSGGHGVLDADAVVIATGAGEALHIAQSMVSPAERDYLGAVRYAPAITLAVGIDRPLCGLPQLVRVPHVEGGPIECALAEPGIADGRAPMGSGLLTLQATERFARDNLGASDEVVSKGLLEGAARLHPGGEISVDSIRVQQLTRRDDAIPVFAVGAYRALDRFRRVQVDRREQTRRLYFAGDYLIGPRPEDSVVSGLRAVQDIEHDLREG